MLILRAHANAWRFAELDHVTKQIRLLPVWRSLGWRRRATEGWYGTLGPLQVALYRLSGSLILQVGDEQIPLDETVSTELSQQGSVSTLRVSRAGVLVREVKYPTPRPHPPLERDLSAGVEAEQFDLGLFVHNVVNDPARRARLAAGS